MTTTKDLMIALGVDPETAATATAKKKREPRKRQGSGRIYTHPPDKPIRLKVGCEGKKL